MTGTIPPSPYQQGLRDGLITARSLLLMSQDLDIALRALAEQIDKSNLDLWSLLAIAQIASLPPEAEALRAHLRAPTGIMIDTAGRMLLVRMNGIDYDTGVLKLDAEIAELKKQSCSGGRHMWLTGDPRCKYCRAMSPDGPVKVVVNGEEVVLHLGGKPVTFEEIVGLSKIPGANTVTYGWRQIGDNIRQGILHAGMSVQPENGMVFNVART